MNRLKTRSTVALFLVLFGIIGVLVSCIPKIQKTTADAILHHSLAIAIISIAAIGVGYRLFVNPRKRERESSYQTSLRKHTISIEKPLFQEYLHSYLKERFPSCQIPAVISFKKNRIYITIRLPQTPSLEQKSLLEEMENDLKQVFDKTFGYRNPIFFAATFHQAKQT